MPNQETPQETTPADHNVSERSIAEIIGWTLPAGAPYIDTRDHDAISIVTVDDLLAWLHERGFDLFAALEAAVRAVDGRENDG